MTSHVFVRRGGPLGLLQAPCEGPFVFVAKSEKSFVVNVRGRHVTVSVEGLKPAYPLADDETNRDARSAVIDLRKLGWPHPLKFEQIHLYGTTPSPPAASLEGELRLRTRSGRRARFPDKLQLGQTHVQWV